MAIMPNFVLPLIKVTFIGGLIVFIGYFVVKGFYNAYSKSFKFFWKYKIRRKPYPEKIVLWCMDCLERGFGWYDAKKFLMINNVKTDQINETLWVYDQIIIEMKGGIDKNGRKFKGLSGKVEVKAERELPKF